MEIETKITEGKEVKETKTEIKEPELVTRVSQVKTEEVKKTEPTEIKEPEFDFKEIENIKDPEAKVWAEKAYKSFQKGFNQKFQEIAEIRKTLEQKQQVTSMTSWTPERLQQEINKPDFVQAAQQVIKIQNPSNSGLTDDEWSTLSETEKRKLENMERELQTVKQQLMFTEIRKEDESLKQKYTNYNPNAVDILTADILANRIKATREHLWKAMDYDEAIQRAYELGKQDKKVENEEKITSMSPEGVAAQPQEGALEKEKTETDRQWFIRNALNRLVKSKEGVQIKK